METDETELDNLGGGNTVDQTTDKTDQETSFGGDQLLEDSHDDGDVHNQSTIVPTGFSPAVIGDAAGDRFADLEEQRVAREELKGDVLESVVGFRPRAVYGEWSRKLLLENLELNRGTGKNKGVIGLKSGGRVVVKAKPAKDGGGFAWSDADDRVTKLKISKLKEIAAKAREEYRGKSLRADVGRRAEGVGGLATDAVVNEVRGNVEYALDGRIAVARDAVNRISKSLVVSPEDFREVMGAMDTINLRPTGQTDAERGESLDIDIEHWENKAEGSADSQTKAFYRSIARVETLTKDHMMVGNELKPESEEALTVVAEETEASDQLRLERFKRWIKKNAVGISAMSISVAGLIIGIIVAARGALKAVAAGLGKFAGAVARVFKKLGPLFAAIGSLVSTALSWGAKGILGMANNLWFLVIMILAALYAEYGRRRSLK